MASEDNGANGVEQSRRRSSTSTPRASISGSIITPGISESPFDVVQSPGSSNHSSPTLHNNGGSEEEIVVKIPIIGFEVMEERARFTVFKLRVENEVLNETWLVFRRYTDFERLHAKIRDEYPHLPINLPPKRWLRDNFETSFLEDRMKGLQAFVDSILIHHKLTESPTIREFFCLDEPPLYPANAEESRAMYGSLEESVMHLKDVLNTKDTEIQILRAQLALINTQHEYLVKQTKNCHHCGHRSSTMSPVFQSLENSSPTAASTPNLLIVKSRNRNGSSRSQHNRNSLTVDEVSLSQTPGSFKSCVTGNGICSPPEDQSSESCTPQLPNINSNTNEKSPSSSSNSDTESATSSPKQIKGIRQEMVDNNLSQAELANPLH